jgi:hypothetical protein
MMNRIAAAWCKKMHSGAMWPIHGKYICSQCLREHLVTWEGPAQLAEYADPSLRNSMYNPLQNRVGGAMGNPGMPISSTVSLVN